MSGASKTRLTEDRRTGQAQTERLPADTLTRRDRDSDSIVVEMVEPLPTFGGLNSKLEDTLPLEQEDFCFFCLKKGHLRPCDNCYRSFHIDCASALKPYEKVWHCQICTAAESKTCQNSGEQIGDSSKSVVLQCTNCYGRDTGVPLWLVASSPLNLEHFFDEPDRLELHQLFLQEKAGEKQLEDLLLKYSMRDKKQKFPFSLCNGCFRSPRKKFQIKTLAEEENAYALVRLEGQPDFHQHWMRVRPSDKFQQTSAASGCNRIERILAWHRPLHASQLNYQECFHLLNSRKLSDLVCGAKNSFYFLIKWEGKPFRECTWESEYFLKDQYDQVLLFCALKSVQHIQSKKGRPYSALSLLEDVITARRLMAKGLGTCIPEATTRSVVGFFEDEASLKKDICIQATAGYDISILIFLEQFKQRDHLRRPSLVVCDKQEIRKWRTNLELFFPQTIFIQLESSVSQDEVMWKTVVNESTNSCENIQIVIADFDVVKHNFHKIIKFDWRWIVVEALVPSDTVFKVLDMFNKPFYRTNAQRIACIPPLTVQSVGKAVINQTISLHVALRRFTNSATLNSALMAQGLFPSANDKTFDFYLSTTQATSLLSSVPSSELPALESRLERPIYFSQLPVVCKLVLRTVILRLSDVCKAEYASVLASNSGWLATCEKNKKFAEASRSRLVSLCSQIACIDDQINPKIIDDDARTLEIDSKVRWIIKYLETLKLNGQMERIVLVFVSEKAQLRSFQVFQRFTKYCCWQINDNVDAAETNIRIAEFSRVEHKITVLTVSYHNLWKIRGVHSGLVIIMGHTGDTYQTELKMVNPSTQSDLRVLRMAYEGVEEELMNLGRPVHELSVSQLDATVKNKYNFVVEVSTIYKMEQVGNTFKKLVDDSLEVTKADQCIIDKTKADSTGWEQLLVGVYLKNFNFHFENVVEDTNVLASWQTVVDKKTSSEEAKLLSKPICRVKHFKNLPMSFTSMFLEPKELFSEDSKLEVYLQKRFLSPRLDKFSNLPQPYLIHTMDFIKMLSFLDFVATHGLHFDSLDNFYKRFCIRYPEEITGSKADFENFKNLVKEFIHLLAYRNTKSFTESVMLCGFDIKTIYRRVLSLTIVSKLVLKYSKNPEEFMTQETVRIPLKLITKKISGGQLGFDYRETYWNNYDLFSLCFAVSRHGFGEWEAILKDEVIWTMHLKTNDPKGTDDDLDEEDNPKKDKKAVVCTFSISDILIDKLYSSAEAKAIKASASLNRYSSVTPRVIGELLRKKAVNFINLVYENSHHFAL